MPPGRTTTSAQRPRDALPGELNLAVSPYHLTTRELTGAVAMTLADHAVTIVPEPADGHEREVIRHAIERVPRLLRVLEAWRWSGPLWRMGLIAGEADSDRPFSSLAAFGEAISTDPALAKFVNARPKPVEPGDEDDRWLDAFCSDLLRGGPDPCLSTMTVAALDRFAASHGYVAVRGSTDSLAQRAESRLMKRVASVAIPVMSRAAGGRILELRAALHRELTALRAAIAQAWSDDAAIRASLGKDLATAAAEYSEAFEAWFARVGRDDDNSERTMRAFVGLTAAALPADAALVCARVAVRGAARASGRKTAVLDEPAIAQPVPQVRVLVIRPMNVRPA